MNIRELKKDDIILSKQLWEFGIPSVKGKLTRVTITRKRSQKCNSYFCLW